MIHGNQVCVPGLPSRKKASCEPGARPRAAASTQRLCPVGRVFSSSFFLGHRSSLVRIYGETGLFAVWQGQLCQLFSSSSSSHSCVAEGRLAAAGPIRGQGKRNALQKSTQSACVHRLLPSCLPLRPTTGYRGLRYPLHPSTEQGWHREAGRLAVRPWRVSSTLLNEACPSPTESGAVQRAQHQRGSGADERPPRSPRSPEAHGETCRT